MKLSLIIIIHVICLGIIGLPSLILSVSDIPPFERGFFCNDESIRYPFKKSTIPFYIVAAIGIGVPCLFIIINESLKVKRKGIPCIRSQKYNPVPKALVNVYTYVGIFIIGALFDQLITNTVKYSVGRLRPHFLSACKPSHIFWNYHCVNQSIMNSYNNYVHIKDSDCEETNTKILINMRKSFPSGHSSESFYCATAFSIYLLMRWNPSFNGAPVVRFAMQVISILLAIQVSVSRISDYKHHPTDCIAGAIVGFVTAILTWLIFLRTFIKTQAKEINEISEIHTNQIDATGF